ncbi:MAG: hypothetical protein Q9166_006754 [cf. Caloplaca sp. 2 TL-2023]
MESFSLPLSSNAVVTGLRTPAALERPPKDTPLIVGIHGGSYSAEYYDATSTHSALPYSAFLRVPFLAINRPGYKDSTALPTPIPENSTYLQEEGKYLHHEILPAIWKAYGTEYGASSIVVLAHSLSVPMTVVAAAFNATLLASNNRGHDKKTANHVEEEQVKETEPKEEGEKERANKGVKVKAKEKPYPLAGIILSGFGTSLNAPYMARVHPLIEPGATRMSFPSSFKDEIMLLPLRRPHGFRDLRKDRRPQHIRQP